MTPLHSILITHRNRNRHLALCLWSIRRSIEATGEGDCEVVVVDNGSKLVPADLGRVRIVVDERQMRVFNKAKLWNRAIDEGRGEVLTFLDADAIVGLEWTAGFRALLNNPRLTRLCYRVRYLPKGIGEQLYAQPERQRGEAVDRYFADYDVPGKFRRAWESWRHSNRNRYEPGWPPWGNSQFSMTREKLADLRYDEGYEGKGFEDLDFMRQVERQYDGQYRAKLDERPARCMFHLQHDYTPDWRNEALLKANCRRYRST